MDSLITAAARALARSDPLGALNRVALRDDASARAIFRRFAGRRRRSPFTHAEPAAKYNPVSKVA